MMCIRQLCVKELAANVDLLWQHVTNPFIGENVVINVLFWQRSCCGWKWQHCFNNAKAKSSDSDIVSPSPGFCKTTASILYPSMLSAACAVWRSCEYPASFITPLFRTRTSALIGLKLHCGSCRLLHEGGRQHFLMFHLQTPASCTGLWRGGAQLSLHVSACHMLQLAAQQ